MTRPAGPGVTPGANPQAPDPSIIDRSSVTDSPIINQSSITDLQSLNAGLYLHIPFCQAICGYCNFNRGLFDEALKTRYLDALTREIAAAPGRQADTIFFGGGTPSLLEPLEVARLVATCFDRFDLPADAEITLETNPETATDERLAGFREAGVTRLSFGVQSFDDAELRRLDRVHSAGRAGEAVRAARQAGFENVSLDLMFWLPGQTLPGWLSTVDRAIDLDPEHLSLYLLELYPNAPLRESMARGRADRPEAWNQAADDEAADMYLAALDRLDAAGYEQYEISNVARPGRSSRHNVKYWQGGDWQGFGCGAHSTVDGVRWKNLGPTAEYIEAIHAGRPAAVGVTTLTPVERIQEALFTGLRLTSGIDEAAFRSRYFVDPWTIYGDRIAPAVDDGHLWRTNGRFGLTRSGMLVANEILQVFV